jgi:protein-tyrosine-phosphatase
MKPFGIEALSHLGVDPEDHAARQLTPELLRRADQVFCMTRAQHGAIVALDPTMAAKVTCLDAEGDIAEPTDRNQAVGFGEQVKDLIRNRFAELSF